MWGYRSLFFTPVSPFQSPVSPPLVDPDEGGDFVGVTFARDWLPLVLGALQTLTLQATWQGDDNAVLMAQQRACLLIDMFASSGGIQVAPSIAPERAVYQTMSTPPGSNVASSADTWYDLTFAEVVEGHSWISIHPTTGQIVLAEGIYRFTATSYNGTPDSSHLRVGLYDQSYWYPVGPIGYYYNHARMEQWLVIPSGAGDPWKIQQWFKAASAGGRQAAATFAYLVRRLTVERYQYE